jgi:hypothetical protein
LKIIKTIFFSGFIAGTLDAVAAIILFAHPASLHNISSIFLYITSGLFGKTAYTSGFIYPLFGLILHYLIALTRSAVYLFMGKSANLFDSRKTKYLVSQLFPLFRFVP